MEGSILKAIKKDVAFPTCPPNTENISSPKSVEGRNLVAGGGEREREAPGSDLGQIILLYFVLCARTNVYQQIQSVWITIRHPFKSVGKKNTSSSFTRSVSWVSCLTSLCLLICEMGTFVRDV